MDELKDIIKQTVNEVLNKIALNEYGPEWIAKLHKAMRDLERTYVPPRSEDVDLEDVLKLIQLVHGLSDYETFMIGENSNLPIDDAFWQRMGPQYAKFIGQYPESQPVQTPVREEEPDPQDDATMMAVNV